MKKKTHSATDNNEDYIAGTQSATNELANDTQDNDQPCGQAEEETPDADDYNDKIEELRDKFLRQAAEFDNYRKRTIKEKAGIIKYASADIMTAILPVIDDMERAVESSKKIDNADIIKEGMDLIFNKLMRILESKGLKKISPKNELFDTDYHEAIALIPAPDEESIGKVMDCARDGYLLDDKVLRHAQVAVAQ